MEGWHILVGLVGGGTALYAARGVLRWGVRRLERKAERARREGDPRAVEQAREALRAFQRVYGRGNAWCAGPWWRLGAALMAEARWEAAGEAFEHAFNLGRREPALFGIAADAADCIGICAAHHVTSRYDVDAWLEEAAQLRRDGGATAADADARLEVVRALCRAYAAKVERDPAGVVAITRDALSRLRGTAAAASGPYRRTLAVGLSGDPGADTRFELRSLLAKASVQTFALADAREVWAEVVRDSADDEDGRERTRYLAHRLAVKCFHAGALADATTYLDELAARQVSPAIWRGAQIEVRIPVAELRGDDASVVAAADAVLASVGDSAREPEIAARALAAKARAQVDQSAASQRVALRLATRASPSGTRDWPFWDAYQLASALWRLDEADTARELLKGRRETTHGRSEPVFAAAWFLDHECVDDARTLLREARDAPDNARIDRFDVEELELTLHAQLGDVQAVRERLAAAEAAAGSRHRARLRALQGTAALAAGAVAEAEAAYAEAAALSAPNPHEAARLLLAVARCRLTCSDTDGVATALEDAESQLGPDYTPLPWHRADCDAIRAELFLIRGAVGDALTMAEAAASTGLRWRGFGGGHALRCARGTIERANGNAAR